MVDRNFRRASKATLQNGSSTTYLAIKKPSRRLPARTTFWFRLQIFFAGSVAQIYEEKASEKAVLAYKKILRGLTLGMLEWPSKYQPLLPPPTDETGYADYQVHQEALRQADLFSERVGEHPDEDERLQLSILRFLRFQSEFVTKDYVPTAEIVAHLKDSGFGDVNDQRIRSSGIAKLRDSDVIITSAAKGYKIPQTRADMNEFLEKASGIVVPLLERVKKGSRGVSAE